jgi:hypothetical protein
MIPITVTAECMTLIGTINKLSITITGLVKSVRAAKCDLDSITKELLSLKIVLELLADDASNTNPLNLLDLLQKQISGIVSNCSCVLADIELTLEKHENLGATQGASWSTSGSEDIQKLCLSLEAHKSALNIALDMVTLYEYFNFDMG